MAMNPGSAGFAMPPAEDDQVRKLRDVERTAREQAAARTLEASTIGKGGILVKDGGSITVEAPGTIDLQGGAFSAATVTATTDITAGDTIQGAHVVATSDMTTVNLTASGPIYSPHGRANPVTSGYVGAWLNVDGRLGATASSVFVKQDFEPGNTAALVDAMYHVALVRFRYIAAVEQFGDAAVSELGSIAQYFVTNGLGEYVFNDADGNPQGINYERLTIPLIAVVQDLNGRLKALGG